VSTKAAELGFLRRQSKTFPRKRAPALDRNEIPLPYLPSYPVFQTFPRRRLVTRDLARGAIANCFILTFRGVSRAAHFAWEKLEARVDGTLERISGVTQFTRYTTRATLTVTSGTDPAKARELLERAEKVCLVANSLRGERILEVQLREAS
jgi:hypothetical protein